MILLMTGIGVIYGLLCAGLFGFQKSMLYFPTPKVNLQAGFLHPFKVNEQTINAVIVNPGNEQALLYFGGNAEQIEISAEGFIQIKNATTYLVNYRGYGGSTGRPSKNDILNDASVIYDSVSSKHSEVIVVGRSLGSGVACYLAKIKNTPKVILITPYDSIDKVAFQKFPLFPIKLLLTQNFQSAEYVKGLESQFSIIYTKNDNVIPAARTQNLIRNIKNKRSVINISKANHNSISNYPEYWEEIKKTVQ